MNDLSILALFNHPLGQIVLIVIVAAITSFITVRAMSGRTEAGAPVLKPGPTPASPRAIEPSGAHEGAVVAAISAAVYAVTGAHRIVYIAPVHPGSSWTAEMRTVHRTSHSPHAH